MRNLAQAVLTPEAEKFIANPATTVAQHIELLEAASGAKSKESKPLNNLIALVANNKRLMLLPEIYALYEAHRAEQRKNSER